MGMFAISSCVDGAPVLYKRHSMREFGVLQGSKGRVRLPSERASAGAQWAAIGVAVLALAGCGGGDAAHIEVMVEEGAVEFTAIVSAAAFAASVEETERTRLDELVAGGPRRA